MPSPQNDPWVPDPLAGEGGSGRSPPSPREPPSKAASHPTSKTHVSLRHLPGATTAREPVPSPRWRTEGTCADGHRCTRLTQQVSPTGDGVVSSTGNMSWGATERWLGTRSPSLQAPLQHDQPRGSLPAPPICGHVSCPPRLSWEERVSDCDIKAVHVLLERLTCSGPCAKCLITLQAFNNDEQLSALHSTRRTPSRCWGRRRSLRGAGGGPGSQGAGDSVLCCPLGHSAPSGERETPPAAGHRGHRIHCPRSAWSLWMPVISGTCSGQVGASPSPPAAPPPGTRHSLGDCRLLRPTQCFLVWLPVLQSLSRGRGLAPGIPLHLLRRAKELQGLEPSSQLTRRWPR